MTGTAVVYLKFALAGKRAWLEPSESHLQKDAFSYSKQQPYAHDSGFRQPAIFPVMDWQVTAI